MKMYLISDNVDTRIGLRLVGIEGSVVHTKDEVLDELDKVMKNKEIGVLLIMENLSKLCPEIMDDIKLTRHLPLVVEIPDRHGTGRSPDFLTNYIREAIGVKL